MPLTEAITSPVGRLIVQVGALGVAAGVVYGGLRDVETKVDSIDSTVQAQAVEMATLSTRVDDALRASRERGDQLLELERRIRDLEKAR